MKRTWLKLLLFLIPAIAATFYVFWRLSPEQGIIRRVDALFSSIEKKALSTDTARDKVERFRRLLSPQLEIKAPRPVPSGSVSPAIAADALLDFQQSVTSCQVSRAKETVAFPENTRAIYQATVEVDVLVGRSSTRVLRYQCRLEFDRVGREWYLRLVVLTPI